MLNTPNFIAPQHFSDANTALEQVQIIYNNSILHLRSHMQRFIKGEKLSGFIRAYYPFVRIHTHTSQHKTSGLAYGFVQGKGIFETTLTRPDLFSNYYHEQFRLLLKNHGTTLEIGTSNQPIPIHFSFSTNDHLEGELNVERRQMMQEIFDLPNLEAMDDSIANGVQTTSVSGTKPLALFTAPRVDYSLHRLSHYTGTQPEWYQNFILFTNYQFYIDEFIKLGREEIANPDSEYICFVEPGNFITKRAGLSIENDMLQGEVPLRLPQMPAYHLVREDRSGVTMVNIGVGPANAKTITDHVAVLRPHAWLMLGHCAGLRDSQKLGDYVMAHAYVREDHVLDEDLPLWIPIPALAEIQQALETAVKNITKLEGEQLKRILRTGTVASTDNRNWELLPHSEPQKRFSQSRAVAVDMESATIAANGFRFRIPYGTLLCVSDKPLHGEIKLPGMADRFYRERVDQHLRIGMHAIDILRGSNVDYLHSRKLRSFSEVAFQ